MATSRWWELSRAALARAEQRARTAAADAPIATGFTNNVDLVVTLDDQMLAGLVSGRDVALEGPRQTRGDTPDQIVTAIVQCIAAGEGIDLPVADGATHDWLRARVSGAPQIGGTSAQVANTLAVLGFPTLISLTGCSAEQVAAFDAPSRMWVPRDGALVALSEAANAADPTMWHVVLEYRRGLTVALPDRTVVAPAANRVIVSYDPVNSAFAVDPDFVDAVANPALGVRRALVSGYSQLTLPSSQRRFMLESIAAVRRWRTLRPDMFVHVEVGVMPGRGELAEVVAAVGLDVSSIGMNQDELRDVVDAWGIRCSGIVPALEAVHHRLMATRLGVHTATYAMTMTAGDPAAERDALLFSTLLASTRARTGRFPTFPELHQSLHLLEPNPDGIAVAEEAGAAAGIRVMGGDALVVVPAPAVSAPAATIGLGDTFTAGILAMM